MEFSYKFVLHAVLTLGICFYISEMFFSAIFGKNRSFRSFGISVSPATAKNQMNFSLLSTIICSL